METANTNIPTNIIVYSDSLQISIDGQVERIDPLVMRLLLYFYDNQDAVINRQTLSDEVWNSPHTSDEAINRGVSQLRKLLSGERNAYIKTVPKQGYQFTLPPMVKLSFAKIEPNKLERIENKPEQKNTAENQQITQPEDIKHRKNHASRNLLIIAALLICLVITISFWPAEQAKQAQQRQSPKRLTLDITPFKVQSSNQPLDSTYINALYSQLKIELEQSQRLSVTPSNKPYVLDITVNQDTDVNITVNIKTPDKNLSHFAKLQFSPQQFADNSKQIINEIAAFTRLMLLSSVRDKRLFKAYNPLSYFEIEQLTKVTKGGWYNFDRLPKQYEFVSQLQQKYPQVAEVQGVLAILALKQVDYLDVDVLQETIKHQKYTRKALSLDPTNYDGILAAFVHSIELPQLRAKAVDHANSMKSYYLYDSRVWRSRLKLMIENRVPCQSISDYVTTIPKGIFKSYRLNVINNILSACSNEQPPQGLYQQITHLPNNYSDRAIINNFKLFAIRHDDIWRQDNRSSIVFNGMTYYRHYFIYQMMRGDDSEALNFLEKIDKNKHHYWQWVTRLYLSLFDSDKLSNMQIIELAKNAPEHEQSLWHNDYVNIIKRNTELYLAAAIIKHGNTAFNQQRLQHYLSKRPAFPINVINRQESLAKIILLHHGGHIKQARRMAKQLYKQLEQNYQTSPASFKFWNLGRYHLLAKLYCGESCQANNIKPQQYFNTYFSHYHIWWLDDYQLMDQALKPWYASPIATKYLQKINDDLRRVQR